jgi:membrane protein implicated in regulation of membrane protease activity
MKITASSLISWTGLAAMAAGLLAVAAALTPAAALLPHAIQRLVAIPVGLALAWMGYALFSERRTSEPVRGRGSRRLR